MRLAERLRKAEAGLPDTLLWFECQRIARETGAPAADVIYDEVREISRKYIYLAVPGPAGKVDTAPVLRAVALNEGFDYGSLVQEARRSRRRLRARYQRAGR